MRDGRNPADPFRPRLKRETPPICHCEGALRPWQSRSTRSDNRKASGEYGSVTQRGVEDAAPYKACAVDIVHGNLQLPKALTERRYRRNRYIPF